MERTPTKTAMRLSDLGDRICILGPSNSGKSTLAAAIARKRGLPAVHLDQLHHLPHTDWQPRPQPEFLALHAEAIAGERWVIDGNYSVCLAERLAQASGLILLDISASTSLLRYLRRTLLHRERSGTLAGAPEHLKWSMVHHLALVSPVNRRRYARLYATLRLPRVFLRSVRAIDRCFRDWDLERNQS